MNLEDKIWIDWKTLLKKIKGKNIILFGRGEEWIDKASLKLGRYKNKILIVDNNKSYHNTLFKNIKVLSPKFLNKIDKNKYFIIITSTAYESVISELQKKFIAGKHYCCLPDYKGWSILKKIREYDKKIIFTSPDYAQKSKIRHSKSGGGIFLFDLKKNLCKKKINGNFRQIKRLGENFVTVEFVKKKLIFFNKKFKIIKKINLNQNDKFQLPNCCGVDYCNTKKKYYVINAGNDQIQIYDKNLVYIECVPFSDQFKKYQVSRHHLNDITVYKGKVYVSYFSLKGGWKDGKNDGGISEVSFFKKKCKKKVIVKNVEMPHSLKFFNNQLFFLGSFKGQLQNKSKKILGQFPGFVRGLDFDGKYFFIGQSENMYLLKSQGLSKNINCNAGIYLFDSKFKYSRFFSLPHVMNIHDLVCLNEK